MFEYNIVILTSRNIQKILIGSLHEVSLMCDVDSTANSVIMR